MRISDWSSDVCSSDLPGELRHAEWEEFDFEGAVWIIPAEKMKMRKPHHVPLSRQALALFEELRMITGLTGYVFPSVRTRSRPMSENTINGALRRRGYTTDEMTAHRPEDSRVGKERASTCRSRWSPSHK